MIYAVVVTYNPDKNLLDSQCASLRNQVDKIIYVDNGSLENTVNPCDKIYVIKNYQNLGLGTAQNQGINIALKEGADFILLLDQDSVPSDGFVSILLSVYNEANNHSCVGLVGPAIVNAYLGDSSISSGIIIKGIRIKEIPLERITKVSYCIASGSMIPASVFKQVGIIEDKLFIDGMDMEWCFRARSKGFSIIQTNATFLKHRLGDGNEDRILSHQPFREYFIIRNSIWLSRQSYIPLGYRLRRKMSPIFRLFISMVRCRGDYFWCQLKGIRDGYKL